MPAKVNHWRMPCCGEEQRREESFEDEFRTNFGNRQAWNEGNRRPDREQNQWRRNADLSSHDGRNATRAIATTSSIPISISLFS